MKAVSEALLPPLAVYETVLVKEDVATKSFLQIGSQCRYKRLIGIHAITNKDAVTMISMMGLLAAIPLAGKSRVGIVYMQDRMVVWKHEDIG